MNGFLGFALYRQSVKYNGTFRRSFSLLKNPSEKETITRLLYNIGSKREVEQYIRQYCSVDSQKFAVIKVGGAVLTDELETLASSLTFLYRVGLYPIVVHGAGPQLNNLLENAGIEPNYADGIRVTDPKTLAIARQCFHAENLKLVEALEAMGTRARPVIGGLFTADFLKQEKYGLVGKITSVNKSAIESSIRSGALPIVTSLAETPSGQILNINADTAAGELAKSLQPLKVVFLNSTGGMFHPKTNEKIDVIELERDYQGLVDEMSKMPKKGTLLKLMEIKQLLDTLPATTSVAITDAQHLSRELFTDSGAGTLIRKGYEFHWSKKWDSAFMKDLQERSEYCMLDHLPEVEQFSDRVNIIGDSSQEIAAAVISEDDSDISRLFWLTGTHSALLHNMADSLWSELQGQHPTFYWVVDKKDVLRSWFFEKCDGSHTVGDRTLFWCGSIPVGTIQMIMNKLKMSDTFLPFNVENHFTRPQVKSFESRRNFSTATRKRVGLIGARGHTGQELINLIDQHPHLDLAYISSRELSGKKLNLKHSNQEIQFVNLSPDECAQKTNEVDCWIMALPNNICKPWIEKLAHAKSSSVVIDLSADHRFNNRWQYGLPEFGTCRSRLQSAKLVANPGCYATGSILTIYPILDSGLLENSCPPSIFGTSGYSGAGTKPSNKNDPDFLRDNIVPYSLVNHMHEREVSHQLQGIHPFRGVNFMPHVAPFFRGITLTVNMNLNKSIDKDALKSLYDQYYSKEPLVQILEETEGSGKDGIPLVRDNMSEHCVRIGGFSIHPSGKRIVMVATLDNLLKGAATQAMQNINLTLGFPELLGIRNEK